MLGMLKKLGGVFLLSLSLLNPAFAGTTPPPSSGGGALNPIASGNILGNISGSTTTPTAVPLASVTTPYYLPAQGINCDGTEIGAVSTTASGTTISSLTYTFSPADVGKVIGIYDAGAQAVNGTTVANSQNLTFITGTVLKFVGEQITGTNITPGTRVFNIAGTGTLNMLPVATAAGTTQPVTFHPPQTVTISSVNTGNNTATVSSAIGTTIASASVTAAVGQTTGTFTQSGTTITVSGLTGALAPTMVLEAPSNLVAAAAWSQWPRTYIIRQLTGTTGSNGTYQVNTSATIASSSFVVDPQTGGYISATALLSGTIQNGAYVFGTGQAVPPQILPGASSGAAGTYPLTKGPTVASTTLYIGARARLGTDVSSAINTLSAAISSSGTGGTIKLPENTACVISSSLQLRQNVSWSGGGQQSSQVWWISTSDNTLGAFATTAPSSNNPISNISIHDFTLDESLATLATWSVSAKGFQANNIINSDVYNLAVLDTSATAVAFDNGNNNRIHNNYILHPGRYGSGQVGSSGVGNGTFPNSGKNVYVITDNVIVDPMNYGIFTENQAFTPQMDDEEVVSNNAIYYTYIGPMSGSPQGDAPAAIGHGGFGGIINGNNVYMESPGLAGGIEIGPGTLPTTSVPGSDTVISNNSVTGGKNCINIDFTNPVTGFPSYIPGNFLINGNRCRGQAALAAATGYDQIRVNSNASVPINHLKISDNVIFQSSRCGILLYGNAGAGTNYNDVELQGNQIFDNGYNSSSTAYQSGVCLLANIVKFDVGGMNVIYDDGANVQKYAISIASGQTVSGGDIDGNDFSGNTTSPFLFTGTYSGIIRNTAGYNPVGCTSVTVTASPMTYTAPITPGSLYVSGGTVTSITQGGQTTGLTSGAFTFSPNEADIVITYSVAPTLIQCQQ